MSEASSSTASFVLQEITEIANLHGEDLTCTAIRLLDKIKACLGARDIFETVSDEQDDFIEFVDNELEQLEKSNADYEKIDTSSYLYICIEGTEGVGKTTQTDLIVKRLQKYYGEQNVLQTKEPGIHLLPVTMKLRNLMLNKKYDEGLTPMIRELISQAIRSIHLEKLIIPKIRAHQNQLQPLIIIQDRGALFSGLAYGTACGNRVATLKKLVKLVCFTFFQTYPS